MTFLSDIKNKVTSLINNVAVKITPTVNAFTSSLGSFWKALKNFASGAGNTLLATAEGLQMASHGVKGTYHTLKTAIVDPAQVAYGYMSQDRRATDAATQQLRQDFNRALIEWQTWASHGVSAFSYGCRATADNLHGLADTGNGLLYGLKTMKEAASLGYEGVSYCAEQVSDAATSYLGSSAVDQISLDDSDDRSQLAAPSRLALAAAPAA